LRGEDGIEAFIRREVLPDTSDAWIVEADTRSGYEISFARHFYQPPKLRTLEEIASDIRTLKETEGLWPKLPDRDFHEPLFPVPVLLYSAFNMV
jgi:type I restriction enzyme M protein